MLDKTVMKREEEMTKGTMITLSGLRSQEDAKRIVIVVNGEKEFKTLKADSEKDSEKEEKSFSHYLRKEARIITEVQELLANEIKARLSSDVCTREIVQLVEPLAKLRIKG